MHFSTELAYEPSRIEMMLSEGRLLRANPAWGRLHGLPHPVFVTADAVRELPAGDLFFAAGSAYHRADPGWRDSVGFEVERPAKTRRSRSVGAVVRTLDDPIEGTLHLICLGNEEGEFDD